jgi:molecular chaperone GrpE
MEDERRYAVLPLVKELLPVMDNLSRAVESAEKSHDVEGLLAGVKLVGQQFQSVLERHNVRPIEALHQPFDPNRHEAILQQPSTEFPGGTVVVVTQEGYQLHDRVVRPAQVIVSKLPEE